MLFQSVSLQNFKSLGEDNNEIIIEPRITTIIGKNESGKSNILEGLSYISLLGNMNGSFSPDNINRNNGTEAEIVFTISLEPTTDEKQHPSLHGSTNIVITKNVRKSTGSIVLYYNEFIRESVNKLISLLGTNPFRLTGQDYNTYKAYISALQQEEVLDLHKINTSFGYLESRLPTLDAAVQGEISLALADTKSKWEKIKKHYLLYSTGTATKY